MPQTANVRSLDAIRDFRAALMTFMEEGREVLASTEVEVQRGLEYFLDEQPQRWRNEVNRSGQMVEDAKKELFRARSVTLPGGGTPSCMEQKKDLDRAKNRLTYAEEKVKIVRRLGQQVERETTEYQGRSAQLASLFDAHLPQAIAFLDRVIADLEAYLAVVHDDGPLGGGTPAFSSAALATPSKKETTPDAASKHEATAETLDPDQTRSDDDANR